MALREIPAPPVSSNLINTFAGRKPPPLRAETS